MAKYVQYRFFSWGAWVAQPVKHLPAAQVNDTRVLGPRPSRTPCSQGACVLPLPLSLINNKIFFLKVQIFSLGIVKNYSKGLYRDIPVWHAYYCQIKPHWCLRGSSDLFLKLAILINVLVFLWSYSFKNICPLPNSKFKRNHTWG